MASAAAGGQDRSISIGRIFSRAFGALRSNPVATLGIAFLFAAVPSLLFLYAVSDLQAVWAANAAVLGFGGVAGIWGFSVLIYLLLWVVSQGALVRATVAYSEGGKASLGESIAAGLRVVLPLFLLAVLTGLALVLGLALLIFPAVILYVMWSVSVPSLVEERLGPIKAFGRSRSLTRGARWTIFGLMLILLVFYWLITSVVGLLSIMSHGGLDSMMAAAEAGLTPVDMALNLVSSTLTAALGGVIHSSLYVELRDWKDGPRTDALADIFG